MSETLPSKLVKVGGHTPETVTSSLLQKLNTGYGLNENGIVQAYLVVSPTSEAFLAEWKRLHELTQDPSFPEITRQRIGIILRAFPQIKARLDAQTIDPQAVNTMAAAINLEATTVQPPRVLSQTMRHGIEPARGASTKKAAESVAKHTLPSSHAASIATTDDATRTMPSRMTSDGKRNTKNTILPFRKRTSAAPGALEEAYKKGNTFAIAPEFVNLLGFLAALDNPRTDKKTLLTDFKSDPTRVALLRKFFTEVGKDPNFPQDVFRQLWTACNALSHEEQGQKPAEVAKTLDRVTIEALQTRAGVIITKARKSIGDYMGEEEPFRTAVYRGRMLAGEAREILRSHQCVIPGQNEEVRADLIDIQDTIGENLNPLRMMAGLLIAIFKRPQLIQNPEARLRLQAIGKELIHLIKLLDPHQYKKPDEKEKQIDITTTKSTSVIEDLASLEEILDELGEENIPKELQDAISKIQGYQQVLNTPLAR